MKTISILMLLACALPLRAQNELPGGKIEVVKDFEVRLAESQKIRIVPQPVPVDSNVRRYTYQLLAPSPSIEYPAPDIKPLAISPEKKPVYYPFFAKAGYGNPNAFLGMLSYDHVQNADFAWGLDLRHLNANNKKIPLQKFSDTEGRLDAQYMLNEKVQIKGYLNGQAEKVYFYGADYIPANEDALKRVYNRYDVKFDISKKYAPESSFRYNAFLQYMTDKDDLGSREKAFKAGGEVGTAFGAKAYPLWFRVEADLSKLSHTDDRNLNNLVLEPWFKWYSGRLQARLGMTAVLNKQQNAILPGIDFSYALSSSGLSLIAGWTGESVKNNFHTLSMYNPYITTRLGEINNRFDRRIYAGLKGGSGLFAFDIQGQYNRFQNMAFFLQDEDNPEQFVPVYDDGTYIGLEGSVRFEILKHMMLRAGLAQRFYQPEEEAKPWHIPSLSLHGAVTYTDTDERYHFSFLFNAENGVPYLTLGGSETTLDPLIDLNLHGDYFITKTIGAFFELNNLLDNNRERWVNYPNYGFNARVGVLFRLD